MAWHSVVLALLLTAAMCERATITNYKKSLRQETVAV